MPYALVPLGYALKKVTKQQKDAVISQRRHEDLLALLENTATPLVLGLGIAALVLLKDGEEWLDKIPTSYDDIVEKYAEFVSPKPDKELGFANP
jgi:hypothetical protein